MKEVPGRPVPKQAVHPEKPDMEPSDDELTQRLFWSLACPNPTSIRESAGAPDSPVDGSRASLKY